MKSDIVKGKETLEDYQKYAVFLDIMMPDEVENPSQFLTCRRKRSNVLKRLRRETFS
jgi:hypothetical protein